MVTITLPYVNAFMILLEITSLLTYNLLTVVEFPFWGSPGFAVYSLDGKVSPCRAAWVWTVSACVCSCVESVAAPALQ